MNLGKDQRVWERVTTPTDDIVFRFKREPTAAQQELIQRYGFQYVADRKEASRLNAPTGREYADNVAEQ